MYWYTSFLRPPPVSCPAGSSILITPQVANDLRTELRYEPTDLFCQWQRVHPKVDTPLRAERLTTFSPPENTYKAVRVELPGRARPGEQWRLGMFASDASAAGPSSGIPMRVDALLGDPGVLSVWSEGISILPSSSSSASKKEDRGKKGKGREEDVPKQGRIWREWTLRDTADRAMLRIVEQTSFDLDKKIWDSGLALSAWLWRHLHSDGDPDPSSPRAKSVLDLLRTGEELDVLELGSGTGLVSIALAAALRARNGKSKARVTATDLDSAVPLMEENIALNTSRRTGEPDRDLEVAARVLDWDLPLPEWVDKPSLIVAADVTYNTAAFPSLLKTLVSLLKPVSSKRKPELLLAYKQRDVAERDLWDHLAKQGVEMEQVDTVRGSESEGQVEIWIGRHRT